MHPKSLVVKNAVCIKNAAKVKDSFVLISNINRSFTLTYKVGLF